MRRHQSVGSPAAPLAGNRVSASVSSRRQVLYEHGIERSTLADIAAAADVPVGNLYYYFKTKDALVSAVIESYLHTFGEMITQLSQEDGPDD